MILEGSCLGSEVVLGMICGCDAAKEIDLAGVVDLV